MKPTIYLSRESKFDGCQNKKRKKSFWNKRSHTSFLLKDLTASKKYHSFSVRIGINDILGRIKYQYDDESVLFLFFKNIVKRIKKIMYIKKIV